MSDEDEEEEEERKRFQSNGDDYQRRLSEIKSELHKLMKQKKKYDAEKLNQDAEFLQSEIIALTVSISDMNRLINNESSTKRRLNIQITNLRSRSQLRYSSLSIALKDKRRYEAELKKEDKSEEYKELARRGIEVIDKALPTLREEDALREKIRKAEDAQQAAMSKRKKLQENLDKNLSKQTEIRKLLNENCEELPKIETNILNLRAERERLLSSKGSKKKSRHQQENVQTKFGPMNSLEQESFEIEKRQCEERLNQVKTLISYFQEKMIEHGLEENVQKNEQTLTLDEEKTILSSFMNENDQDENHLQPAIAMKLPKNFSSSLSNEIIHSSTENSNLFEYKKEFSSDILNKYGGKMKKTKSASTTSKHRRKHFAVSHRPQMIVLYNQVRSLSESSDILPTMPMHEYDLLSTIKSLQSFQQSLEFYLIELTNRSKDDRCIENEDSIFENYSETSSLTEQLIRTNLLDHQKSIIDRQISDEGYRSVQNENSERVDQWLITTTNEEQSPHFQETEFDHQ